MPLIPLIFPPLIRNSARCTATAFRRDCRWSIQWLSGLCLLLSSLGCELTKPASLTQTREFKLPPLTAPKEAVQLQILFVDRSVDDPLLGDSMWRELDQIADMPSDLRTRLRNHGWRIGHASSHPPRAIEEFLKLTADRNQIIDLERGLISHKLALTAGSDAPIELTDVVPVLHWSSDKDAAGRDYENAKAVLRMRVEREQDGWARLHFLPEIHHGEALLRPVPGQFEWTHRRLPEVEPLYDQQFSLSLNLGESAVVTVGEDKPGSVGQSFFRSLDKAGRLQRLLVVRVTDMQRLSPVYSR